MRGRLAGLALWLMGGATIAAQPRAPFIVTATPIQVGLGNLGLCIAIDPIDPHGVWWWQPGALGCETRSTGPGVFRGDQATVSRPRDGIVSIGFRLGTHSIERPFVPVRLVLDGHRLRSPETMSEVGVVGRRDLEIPEDPRGPRR